ncbi:zinc finger protein 839 isoform X2 [Latimeria chalumnae]|uniref:zinc finger protein 839 isoform X2 n=1 Tax=Latimeria chalumnae TaxID=7897 RepID=UPI0006D9322D|nr:PREDICTED: zinc finger protein 839 isoform X2 [Latimeria chalumnae]|eukprot:XP_014352828.1 PREDICTED: zinc finger protein 839 isoform X2 [Latimeria chalumnae]
MADQDEESSNMTTGVVKVEPSAENNQQQQIHQITNTEEQFVTESTISNCAEYISKQFTVHQPIPEYVQIATSASEVGETVVGNTQVVNALATGEGLLVEGNIIGSLDGSSAAETLTAINTEDFTEELVQNIADMECSPTSTIIYVQPDGTFVEGTGLTPEEQHQLVEQLAKQHIPVVQVTENEAAQLYHSQQQHSQFIQHAALVPEELQQVIEQVTKSQQHVVEDNSSTFLSFVPQDQNLPEQNIVTSEASCISHKTSDLALVNPQNLIQTIQQQTVLTQPVNIMHNAAQQLQNVAQQVALQHNQTNSATPLLQPKLDTTRIQVKSVQAHEKEKFIPPLSAVQPKIVALNQSANKCVSAASALNFIGPQIIRIQPVAGTGQQQLFLHSSSEPPIQLLVQKAPPPLGPITTVRKIPLYKPINGQMSASGILTTSSSNVIPVTTSVTELSIDKKLKDKLRVKRPLKVKTRSGRISRPPKYKVKDYKFIKTEDLADGHQSDSDDYSELSVEEDEEGVKKDIAFCPLNYNLKPKKFKCETCEKSYIGKGGLARHYKLNPSHEQPNFLQTNQRSSVKPNGGVPVTDSGGGGDDSSSVLVSEPLVMLSLNNECVSPVIEEVTTAPSQESQQDLQLVVPEQTVVLQLPAPQGPGRPRGPGRTRGPKRSRQSALAGRPGYAVRSGRPGRPPKSLGNITTEQQVTRRKARLKEILQQCENEELMELALPRLTKVITVWEFLLMKVEKGYPSKPYFADVYKEFEDLYTMVKKMAEDHFNNSVHLSLQRSLEIKNVKVAESLGILEKVLRKQKQQAADTSERDVVVTIDDQLKLHSSAKKHGIEREDEKLLPPDKRARIEISLIDTNSTYFSQKGKLVEALHLSGLTAEEGIIKQVNGDSKIACITNGSLGVRTEDTSSVSLHSTNEFKGPIGVEADTNPCHSNLLLYQSTEVASQPSLEGIQGQSGTGDEQEHTVAFLSMDTDITSEDLVQEHLSNHSMADQLTDVELSDPVQTEHGIHSSSTLLSSINKGNLHKSESTQEHCNSMNSRDPLTNHERSEQLHASVIADQMQQLENVLSTAIVSLDHSNRTQSGELRDQIIHETASSTQVRLESQISHESVKSLQVANPNELCSEIEQSSSIHSDVESTVTVDETVAFQLSDESHELLTQGHEQIFIHTSDGLILSHPGAALVSQTEGIVIVTNADGTTMHIRTPEGVPLETVEALLAMEAEGQSEGILVSQMQ